MGIAYAAPDMEAANFWGVMNHDNEEGIIRIADNKVIWGLKMWTWGFPTFTNETDERGDPNRRGPMSNYGPACPTSSSTAPTSPRWGKCRFRRPTARRSA